MKEETGQHVVDIPGIVKVEHKRAYQDVAMQLKAMIMAGELQIGDRLPNVRDLAESFGVSKATVSEAFRVLDAQGLIETQQGLGTYVRNRSEQVVSEAIDLHVAMTAKSVQSIYEFRKMFEPKLARLAVHRIAPEQLAEMEAVIARMQGATQITAEFMAADVEFHNTLFCATGNEIAATIARAIHHLTVDTWLGVGAPRDVPEKTCAAHNRILQALKEGDCDAVETAMRRHLEESAADLQRIE